VNGVEVTPMMTRPPPNESSTPRLAKAPSTVQSSRPAPASPAESMDRIVAWTNWTPGLTRSRHECQTAFAVARPAHDGWGTILM
jgi:hypothetical protein